MRNRNFSLEPFETEDAPSYLKINGTVGRSNNTLSSRYVLQGTLSEIIIPATGETRLRKYGLWEETCLEFFLAAESEKRYWEFNLSPSGQWNVYRFTSYRKGMKEETAIASLPFSVRRENDTLTLILELALEKIIPADKALEVAVSAVIKTTDGRISYWALTHPASQPDFHLREGFVIGL